MSSTDLTPVAILTAATDLVRRRAARPGPEPAPATAVTIVLDDAARLIADPSSPARDLLTEIMVRGRAVGVHLHGRSRLPRQYATLAELNAASERGEL